MEYLEQMWFEYGTMVINFAVALIILVAFYIAAAVARALVRRLLARTGLDNKLVATVGLSEDFPVEKLASGTVFWLVLIYGFLTFLDKLNLETVAQPVNSFLTEIFAYLPKLGAALGLIILAWVLAGLAKLGIAKMAELLSVDQRLNELDQSSDEDGENFTVGESLATAAYWFVFLLFLPIILGTLGMQSLVTPLQDMFSKIFTFLPNIVSAALIFAIGSFAARIVRKVVTSLLAASGIDSYSDKVGLDSRISALVGTLVFTVMLLLVIVQSLDALQVEAISGPASDMIGLMFAAVPGILSAALVLGISWYVGKLVAGLLTDLLSAAGFNALVENLGISAGEARTPSDYAGYLVLLAVMLLAVLGATELLGFAPLSAIVAGLIDFTFRVVLGAVVLALGIMIARKVAELVNPINPAAASLSKVAILVLTTAMALREVGVADDIINLAFAITLGAIGVGAAIAIGLGGKDAAGREVEAFINRLRS